MSKNKIIESIKHKIGKFVQYYRAEIIKKKVIFAIFGNFIAHNNVNNINTRVA